jgi:small subunit ribosomal protein S9
MSSKATSKNFHASGKRKRAVARVTVMPGTGIISINSVALSHYGNELNRARIREPLLLAGDAADKLDIKVRVAGGGATGQADAVRLAIARALVQYDASMRQKFLDYDRQLIVADIRRKESAKPNSHGQARSKVQKSYR